MIIDFKKTGADYAIKYSFFFDIARIFKSIFLFFSIILAFILLFNVSMTVSPKALFLISFSLFLSLFILDDFLDSKLKNGQIKNDINRVLSNPNQYNLAEFFSYNTAKTIQDAINYTKRKRIEELDSSILLYFCIKNNPELNFIFSRLLIDPRIMQEILKNEIKESKKGKFIGFTENFQKVILTALEFNRNKEEQKIEVGDLIVGLAEHSYTLKTIITRKNAKLEDVIVLSRWLDDIKTKIRKTKQWWRDENLLKYGSLARDWASSYTLLLDKYSTNFTDIIKERKALLNEMVEFDKEIEIIERILQKSSKNNVLIVGDLGVGRRKIISELARRSFLGISLSNINYKKVLLLDLQLIISATKSTQDFSLLLNKIFNEVVFSKNIILVIEDIHNYIGQEKKPGTIDISGILNNFLELEDFRLIGVTSFINFQKYIFPNEAFLSYFEKVELNSLSKENTIRVLQSLTFFLEKKYKVFITYSAIKAIVEYADKYLQQEAFPGKAINLLDDVIHYSIYTQKKFIILKKDVAEVIFQKTKIPVGETEIDEANTLLNLEELIKKRLIGQEEAIKAVSSSLRRARSEITIKGGPMGGFLFLGPTGVGKTELSKVLANIYFGTEKRMIRVDMSEFQNITDVSRLIGSTSEQGYLTTQVSENPFSLILLDEIEKAHPDILNLFLQILDEGYITDGVGRKINFKNTIIIATSNAGAKIILDSAGKKIDQKKLKEKLLKHIFENAIFKPEFINRFDAVVLFHSLTKKNLLDISELLLNNLKENLDKKNINLTITDELKKEITELSYKPEFGAREMKRVIQDNIEDKIAVSLLNDTIKAGDKIKIDPKTFKLIKAN